MKKLLIVIDMQNDFITGSLGTPHARAIVRNVKAKIDEYNQRGEPIVFTRDTHNDNYGETQEGRHLPVEHCIFGSEGWKIHVGLDDGCAGCLYVDKPAFGWPHWDETLRELITDVDEIELCGLCTDICVVSNALILKAHFPETKITVDAKCCAGVTEESHKAALETMKMCQVNVVNE